MDLGWSEEQELLRTTAREFLERECPESLVRAMEADERGFAPELWRRMAELGWTGLMIPHEYGGAGLSLLDLTILAEECGRFLVPGPFLPNAVAAAELALAGNEAQRATYLPPIAEGRRIHTYAVVEPSGRWDPTAIALTAEPAGDGWRLTGTKSFVPDAQAADYLHVAAHRGEAGPLHTFIVPRNAEGVTVRPLKTIAGDKEAEVALDRVWVAESDVIATDAATAARVRNLATVLECAYLVGLAQRDMEISLEYARTRVQFGKPIGSFQAIQHKAADMVSDVDGARFITYRAAWAVSEGEASADLDVAMAKAWCSDASRHVVAHGQQIHGGIGYTQDYPIQLFFRRQKRAELFWGDADYHRRRVAQILAL